MILTFGDADAVLANDIVRVARAVSNVTDRRFVRILDVNDDPGHGFVVTEWAAGDTLGALVSRGPMEPDDAALLIAESADALSAVHSAGFAHLCLMPDSIRWKPGSGVKISGLGLDAVLTRTMSEDPPLDDTRGLGSTSVRRTDFALAGGRVPVPAVCS